MFREPQTLTLTLKGLVRKGYTPKQAKEWKAACLQGQRATAKHHQQEREQAKRDKKEIRALKQELTRKEKALAAALLVLRKKFNALWEEKEDN